MEAASGIPSPAEPVPEEFDLLCEGCGYSLVGLIDSSRCPECGREFDPTELPLARVPWLYRKRLGRVRAYFRTVRLIVNDPRAFAVELCRPVRISSRDAYLFRLTTTYIVFAAALLGVLVGCGLVALARGMRGWNSNEAIAFAFLFALGLLVFHLLVFLGTDMPTFIWRGLQNDPNNLSPLHHYACAPLARSPLVVLLGSLAAALMTTLPGESLPGIIVAAITGLAMLLMIRQIWRIPQIFMRAATRCSVGRVVLLGLYLPIHWLLLMVASGLFILAMAAILFVYIGIR